MHTLPGMSTPVHLSIVLYQGTTQRVPLVRRYLPFAVTGNNGLAAVLRYRAKGI